MGYSAGNLELSILGVSKKAVASIDMTAKALHRLASAVNKINNTQFVFAGQKLEVLFTKIAKATNSINTNNITNLASAAKSLSSISRLGNLDKMDFDKVGKGFNTLSIAIQPFLNKVREAEASLTALDGILRRSSGKKMQGLLGSQSGNKRGGLFGFAKLGISIYSMRRLGRFAGELVQAGSDYTETLNLWQVAMSENLDIADQFVNKMQKAYGISSKTLMNAQAIFKNMIGSLGQISEQTAYKLSEALVQMSADFSSLYNVELEQAFEKMQAMLAGQVRPIRSAGLDMTETTLYQFYQELGGTKSMRQLNRTEKQLLSILAVYRQMFSAGALGDMSKTLNSFANQSRMMVENFKELKTWTGLILKDWLEQHNVLVYINAALITMANLVREIANKKNIGNEDFLAGMFETTEATNEEIDELQGKLLDFDKFRALNSDEDNALAIDEELLKAISGYESKLDDADNKAQSIADEWSKLLGITRDLNGELAITDEIYDSIAKTASLMVAALAGLSILGVAKNILSVLTIITSFGGPRLNGIKTIFSSKLLLIVSIISAAIYLMVKNSPRFVESLGNLLDALSPILVIVISVLSYVGKILDSLAPVFKFLGNVFGYIVDALAEIIYGLEFIITVFYGMYEILAKIVYTVTSFLNALVQWDWSGFKDKIKDIWSDWNIENITEKISGKMESIDWFWDRNKEDGQNEKIETSYGTEGFGVTSMFTTSQSSTSGITPKQMEQAFYNALQRHSQNGDNNVVVTAYLDGEKVYENTTARAKARGNIWAKA